MAISLLYGVLFISAWHVLRRAPGAAVHPRWPWVLIAITVAGAIAQLVHPGLEAAAERSAQAIGDGELWRLITSFLVQGGGWWGIGFNLITLAITAPLAARVLGAAVGPAVYVLGGVAGNGLSLLLHFPDDAGSSLACMTLAVTATTAAVIGTRGRSRAMAVATAAHGVTGALLVIAGDQHGIAVAAGLLAGVLLGYRRRRHPAAPAD